MRKILVPLDGSPLAEIALPYAISLAQKFHAEVVLLRIFTLPLYPFTVIIDMDATPMLAMEAARNEAFSYLEQIAPRLRQAGVRTRTVVRCIPVADGIIDFAQEEEVDLIVMSTHGRSGVGRWLLGSVADRVLRGAAVPVLLIRAPRAQNPITVIPQETPPAPS
ncbi:MAG: universal stress protein [Chloroflexi bacterium]|nr:universal stress protein [Chloroflexota bacterium]